MMFSFCVVNGAVIIVFVVVIAGAIAVGVAVVDVVAVVAVVVLVVLVVLLVGVVSDMGCCERTVASAQHNQRAPRLWQCF